LLIGDSRYSQHLGNKKAHVSTKKVTNNKQLGWYGIEKNRDFMLASCLRFRILYLHQLLIAIGATEECILKWENFGLERKFWRKLDEFPSSTVSVISTDS
jgi:hypothetical protein